MFRIVEIMRELPFYNLTDMDLPRELRTWVFQSRSMLESKDLFADVIASPNKTDDRYESNFGNFNLESKYLDVKQTSKCLEQSDKNGISLFHSNTRSLGKNIDALNDILTTCKETPNIIAISERKLNDNSCVDITLPGYRFSAKNSPTNAGGVGMYIKENINFIRRSDIEFDTDGIETCFIEIPRTKQQNIVVGCIYRHPSTKPEKFHDILKEKLEYINSSGFEAYLTGDINIDFLKYTTDKKTSDYLDMLFNFGFMPLITKATRITHHSKTLIDHIYTNAPEKIINTGICLADISDHLPCFCTSTTKATAANQQRYFRDFSNFSKELFTEEINKIDFMALVNSDVNESMNNIIKTMQDLTDKHVPLKKASNSKKNKTSKALDIKLYPYFYKAKTKTF